MDCQGHYRMNTAPTHATVRSDRSSRDPLHGAALARDHLVG